jgi:molybdate transport system substrate-binding protein
MRTTWLLLIFVAVLLRGAVAEEITVAAAADLNYALTELAIRFEASARNEVKLSFGAAGKRFPQIQNGAPFDLFFSADEDYPKKLASTGVVDASSLRIYALGHLALWVPANSTFDPEKLQLELLTQSGVWKIAIGNRSTRLMVAPPWLHWNTMGCATRSPTNL